MPVVYKAPAISWRVIAAAVVLLMVGTQFTVSPSSRQMAWIFTVGSGGSSTVSSANGRSGSITANRGNRGTSLNCPEPTAGPALSMPDAVKRYTTLPYSMRRKGGSTTPLLTDENYNLTCYAGLYGEGQDASRSACGWDAHVFYPKPPASPKTTAPDVSQEKAERCAALKADIRSQPNTLGKLSGYGVTAKDQVIPVSNVSCTSGNLCVYPKSLSPTAGGRFESVNTELGVELVGYIPFYHYEAAVGALAQTTSTADSAPFYFWSEKHCEWDPRMQRAPNGMGGDTPWPYSGLHFGLVNAHVKRDTYPKERFINPPWFAHYCGWGLFPFMGQRYAVIHNKRKTTEFMGRPVNTMEPETLIALYDLLKDNFVVVYQRPTAGLFKSEEGGFSEDLTDITALEEHAAKVGGALYVMPRLLQEFTSAAAKAGLGPDDVSVNELQLIMLAEADVFISVQGGPGYLTYLWGPGKQSLIVQRKSPELPNDAISWFDLISGLKVHNTYSERDLVTRTKELFYLPYASQAERDEYAAKFYGVETAAQRRLMVLKDVCLQHHAPGGGGLMARFDVCFFRSAAQIVVSTEEVYLLGYWLETGSWLPGTAEGSDPKLEVPAGQMYTEGADCEGKRGTPRIVRLHFSCDKEKGLLEPLVLSAGEPAMCEYELRIALPHEICFGEKPSKSAG